MITLNFNAKEVNWLKGVTEYGGDYSRLNRSLEWNKPARLRLSSVNSVDLLYYAVEGHEDDSTAQSIREKLNKANGVQASINNDRTFDPSKYYEYLERHIGNVQRAYAFLVDAGIVEEDAKTRNNIEKHDQSKYSDEEFDPYGERFYGKYKDSEEEDPEFKKAWLHHQHNNPHHWQHWCLLEDDNAGEIECLDMPEEYLVEMVCDWLSFSIENNDLSGIQKWYKENKGKQKLSENTRERVEDLLSQIDEKKSLWINNTTAGYYGNTWKSSKPVRANGDMIAYYRDHTEELKKKKEEIETEKKGNVSFVDGDIDKIPFNASKGILAQRKGDYIIGGEAKEGEEYLNGYETEYGDDSEREDNYLNTCEWTRDIKQAMMFEDEAKAKKTVKVIKKLWDSHTTLYTGQGLKKENVKVIHRDKVKPTVQAMATPEDKRRMIEQRLRGNTQNMLNARSSEFDPGVYEMLRENPRLMGYIEPWMDTAQAIVIQDAIDARVDVSKLQDPKYNWMQMNAILEYLKQGIDVTKYTKEGRDVKNIGQIGEAIKQGMTESQIRQMLFMKNWMQMREIRLGHKAGIDVQTYATRPQMDWQKMREIRKVLTEEKINIRR